MTPEEAPLVEIVKQLEDAWNRGDSVERGLRNLRMTPISFTYSADISTERPTLSAATAPSSTPSTKAAATISRSKASASCVRMWRWYSSSLA